MAEGDFQWRIRILRWQGLRLGASTARAHDISLDENFSRKHASLSMALTTMIASRDSQWQVARDKGPRSARSITKKCDLVELLLSVRRAGAPVAGY